MQEVYKATGVDVLYDLVSIGVDILTSALTRLVDKSIAKERAPAQQRSPKESFSEVDESYHRYGRQKVNREMTFRKTLQLQYLYGCIIGTSRRGEGTTHKCKVLDSSRLQLHLCIAEEPTCIQNSNFYWNLYQFRDCVILYLCCGSCSYTCTIV